MITLYSTTNDIRLLVDMVFGLNISAELARDLVTNLYEIVTESRARTFGTNAVCDALLEQSQTIINPDLGPRGYKPAALVLAAVALIRGGDLPREFRDGIREIIPTELFAELS